MSGKPLFGFISFEGVSECECFLTLYKISLLELFVCFLLFFVCFVFCCLWFFVCLVGFFGGCFVFGVERFTGDTEVIFWVLQCKGAFLQR